MPRAMSRLIHEDQSVPEYRNPPHCMLPVRGWLHPPTPSDCDVYLTMRMSLAHWRGGQRGRAQAHFDTREARVDRRILVDIQALHLGLGVRPELHVRTLLC